MIHSALRFLSCVSILSGLVGATAAHAQTSAQDRVVPQSWTGFYIGAQLGGGWGDLSVGRGANDTAAGRILSLDSGGLLVAGQQVVPSHGLSMSGVTGGIEIGYNWQIAPRWIAGFEADFSASNMRGSGSASSTLASVFGVSNVVDAEQQIDWWGTVRARLGWLATPDLLLFGTAGLAYGRVSNSDSYTATGLSGLTFATSVVLPGGTISVSCATNTPCFAGSESSTRIGWTVGGGGEWRWSEHWSLKAEYLYVNLGATASTSTALAVFAPGDSASSYSTLFGTTDFHVARLGVNYRF